MIRRSTWVLLAAFALVLGGALIWTRTNKGRGVSASAEATPTLTPLWSVPTTDILGLRVENLETGSVVELRRGDEQTPWKMVKPEEGAADASRVEWAVTALVSPRPQAILAEPDDLAPFGLAKPAKRVTVFLAGDVTRSFEIGRVSPTGGVFYALVPGTGGIVLLNEYSLSDVLSLLDELPYPPTATAGAPTSPPPTGTPAPSGS
jgi:hypothetical protein